MKRTNEEQDKNDSETNQALKDGERGNGEQGEEIYDHASDTSEESIIDQENDEEEPEGEIFLAGQRQPGQVLEPDMTSYECLHFFHTNWPCLSFDMLRDTEGDERRSYPAKATLIAGTQAERPRDNEILFLTATNLVKTVEEENESGDDEEAADDEPVMTTKSIPVPSCTNRIRARQTTQTTIASFHEDAKLRIWNLDEAIQATQTGQTKRGLLATVASHQIEGYALAWSSHEDKLLSGDNNGEIFLTMLTSGGYATESSPFKGHKSSVEDISFSPNERTVFCSAGSDGFLRVWDTRREKSPALSISASSSDVNVMSWNSTFNHLLASGHDDGSLSVWDLRQFRSKDVAPVAHFTHHHQPITSVDFHPSDDSVVLCASADSTVTIWDLAVEEDEESVEGIPPQMLFQHVAEDPKESHWHPQHPGMFITTGSAGWCVAKTISV